MNALWARCVCCPATLSLALARMGSAAQPKSSSKYSPELHAARDQMSMLDTIDRICGQFATALQHAQLQVYATIAVVVVLSVLLFPPKDDPDQI
jgi:hypothetical protein